MSSFLAEIDYWVTVSPVPWRRFHWVLSFGNVEESSDAESFFYSSMEFFLSSFRLRKKITKALAP